MTTTYTNSTEQRALTSSERLGADIKVSYDTHDPAPRQGLDLPPRVRLLDGLHRLVEPDALGAGPRPRVERPRVGARNPDVVAKMAAVFDSYWESGDFVPVRRRPSSTRHGPSGRPRRGRRSSSARSSSSSTVPGAAARADRARPRAGPPPQPARRRDRHRQDRHGRVDYARLARRPGPPPAFVAHREEILDQSLATFRYALRDASFGEMWVGGQGPSGSSTSSRRSRASTAPTSAPDPTTSTSSSSTSSTTPPRRPTRLLDHLTPVELLGLTATPERSDGLAVLDWFDGRIAAELRLWDAIDQQYLAPFLYFGIHDGLDLREVPGGAAAGYDVGARTSTPLRRVGRLVVRPARAKVADDVRCARSASASASSTPGSWPHFTEAGIPPLRSGATAPGRARARCGLEPDGSTSSSPSTSSTRASTCPAVDTLLLLRPTESPTLFLQQLGRGLRKRGQAVLHRPRLRRHHRKEFRFDRRYRALLGGSAGDVERQVRRDFPFLPAGCHMQLDQSRRRSCSAASAKRSRALARRSRSCGRSATSASVAASSTSAALNSTTSTTATQLVGDAPRGRLPDGAAGPVRDRCGAVGACCTSTTTSGSTHYRPLATSAPHPTRRHQHARAAAPAHARRTSPTGPSPRRTPTAADAVDLWAHPQVRAS